MSIKRYTADKDNTITNAFNQGLVTRMTGANMGASDILEVYSLYAQASSSASGLSTEKSRVLISFPMTQIIQDRSEKIIPASGSVDFYLRLFNAKHGSLQSKNFTLVVAPISQSWTEGIGLDMEEYSDEYSSNWVSATDSSNWTTAGGDYLTNHALYYTFDTGVEDMELDISPIIEKWIDGTIPNYGVGIYLTSSQENSTQRSYYTKKFFGRGTEFFFKKPLIEARYDDSIKDKRGDFYYSSSLLTAQENINTIYLYNRVRGSLRNIPSIGTNNIYLSIFTGSETPVGNALTLVADGVNVTAGSPTVVTGGWVSTGVYTASFAINSSSTNSDNLYDVWHNGNLATQFYTGSFVPKVISAYSTEEQTKYVTKITNLKQSYFTDETALMRVYARPRNWYPNIYTVAQDTPETTIIPSASYSVFRVSDDFRVIPHGTGSSLHTLMSYDVLGNYFKFDMGMLEPDYSYGIEISIYNTATNRWDIQQETFKFRVEKRQTE